jgi:choline-sulfatase
MERPLWFAALALIALSAPSPGSGADRAGAPDIVLVSIDSLRPDHLGSYGYDRPTSPTMDRLAAGGARFATAMSTTSWTLPAHAALFTGLYDSTHGLVDNGLELDPQHLTLAEVLRDAGYQTAGFYGGPYLHPVFGLGQGFDVYRSCMTRLDGDLSEAELRDGARKPIQASHADVTGPRTRDEFRSWLEAADERPAFVFLHLWDVHFDYIPPRRYVELFDPDYSGALDATSLMTNAGISADMDARDLEHLVALYDGEIRFTDDMLGEILTALGSRGRLENTLIVITADHGEEFFEHGSKGHQRTLFDEVARVPLIFHLPGVIEAGRVIEEQVRIIDVMPSVLALAGVAAPPGLQGRDLGHALRGLGLAPRPALLELLVDGREIRALRSEHRKLISLGGRDFPFFDLAADPGEARRLASEGWGFDRARAALREQERDALALRKRRGFGALAVGGVDQQVTERLKALGYVEPDDADVERAPAPSQ